MSRHKLVLVLVGVFASLGATHRTANFIVHAPDPQMAQQIGQYAEHYRREKALAWVGQEMPPWSQPCPLYVTVSMEGPSGATSFNFGHGRVLGMRMEINGPYERLLHSVLPHEITHTVFAHHFRTPVPRWADEGGSVLSEDDIERDRHDKLVRQILNQGRQIPLRRLLMLKEYPRDVMCLYAQGFSLADYLVKRGDRRTFLNFVGHGMNYGWDSAVQTYYNHRTVEELEETWLQYLRDTRRTPETQLAQNGTNAPTGLPNRTLVRLTAPPVQPLEPAPVVRGMAPTPDQVGQRFGDRPGFLSRNPSRPAMGGWQPARPPASQPAAGPAVQLGPPQYGPFPPGPMPAMPVGFPN